MIGRVKNISVWNKKNMDEKINEVMKGLYEKLTDEQKEKAKTCKNMDELL